MVLEYKYTKFMKALCSSMNFPPETNTDIVWFYDKSHPTTDTNDNTIIQFYGGPLCPRTYSSNVWTGEITSVSSNIKNVVCSSILPATDDFIAGIDDVRLSGKGSGGALSLTKEPLPSGLSVIRMTKTYPSEGKVCYSCTVKNNSNNIIQVKNLIRVFKIGNSTPNISFKNAAYFAGQTSYNSGICTEFVFIEGFVQLDTPIDIAPNSEQYIGLTIPSGLFIEAS